MSAKKCCCCGLLSCFPCFSAQPDSSEIAAPPLTVITNPSPAATLSSAPPSAAAPSQVNAATVMQNDSQPTAPSDAVPSSSRGIVTPSALIPTTSQTTASTSDAPSSSTSAVPSSSTPSSSVLKEPDYCRQIRRDADAVDRGNKEADLDELKTPSSSRLPTESDYAETIMEAVKELDKENVDGDFSDLINYISRLLDFIEEKKKGKNPSMPKAAVGSCLASNNFLRLKDVVSEGVNAVKDIVTTDGKTFLMGFLKGMGMAHMVTTGFLVAASILERHEAVSANKEACLYLLKEMNILAHHVQQLQQRPALKKGMEAPIREATMLIVEASIDCCTQIGASKFSSFFSATVNGEALAKFQKRLADMHTHMQAGMDLCQFDAINQIDMRLRRGHELKYPEYPKGTVGIEYPLKEVIERLEMGSDKNAVAVMVHGFGGMGKTTLADAVFARLFDANREGYKYSYVRLFDTIASVPNVVKLQRCILTDLMMGEESEIPEIRRYEEGQQVIEDMLEKEAVFIYIDNVLLPDKVEEGRDALHHLLPKNMRNARKLRLLLTTRDKDAVRITGVNRVFYSIQILPEQEALYLFKKTLDDNSEEQLQPKQLKQIVDLCGGVPKLLKVVAGFISSEENVQQAYSAVLEERKNNWKGEIRNDMKCYIFAYENLEETLKEIFLDICVFFQGWDWETLSTIVGEAELKMLEKRALVTKDVKSMTVRVHDVMLAIGLDKKGERFRFTRASDFQKFLKKDNDQLEKIKGIWSSDDSNLLYIPASKLDLMHRSLRVVILGKSTKVEGKSEKIFEELVIFRARDSDLPFDKSKLEKFKKLKLSHLICKSEDLENLSEGSLQGMKAPPDKGSIVEIGSKPPEDSNFELGASSTGTLPTIPTDSGYAENICAAAAAAVENETIGELSAADETEIIVEIETDVDLSEPSETIGKLSAADKTERVVEIETDVDLSEPSETIGKLSAADETESVDVNLSDLIKSVREAAAAVEIETGDVNLSELSNYVSQLLNLRKEKKMGNDPLKPRGAKYFLPDSKLFFKSKEFLAVFFGRYESISTNKDAWWSLLNEINKFSEHVQQLQKRPGLREGMKVSIREATTLIAEATSACCTQINASKFSRFFSSTLGKKELAKFKKKLQEVDTHVRNQMDLCLFDAVSQPKSHFAKYPRHADSERRDGFSGSGSLFNPLILFSLDTLTKATGEFHEDNKLGEGGFGAVYKGITSDGTEIAVKKLSLRSAQGTREFMNEVKLVPKIQHRNLVRLLGYCVDGPERLLVYEYLPNKSLDNFLFHPEKRRVLDWQKRYKIVMGIARGLLYLHEDSHLRVIHRNVKVSNILLDDKLNAKISGFGLAIIFPDDKTHVQLSTVAGTVGYMDPKYVMSGQLSVKSDVYSFGVVLLEIVSGRRHTDIHLPQEMQNLLEWGSRLCNGGNLLDLIDPTIVRCLEQEQALRCIRVGLLCVQADWSNRPTMSDVIVMLSTNSVAIPNPTKPAFCYS